MLSSGPETLHQQLKILNTEREKVLSAINSFSRTSEAEDFLGREVYKVVKTINRQTLSGLKKQLAALDEKIGQLIRSDEDLKHKQELLKSIPGIGEVGSVYFLLVTKGFTHFKNWRKFACYCGIALFEYSSGSSIRVRNRVNPVADKKMKSLLHLLSPTTIRHDEELKLYYNRTKEEGKHSLASCFLFCIKLKPSVLFNSILFLLHNQINHFFGVGIVVNPNAFYCCGSVN
ncbi:transposase [Chryseobacterium lacus]|uniref:transposase n=1 Tax=Chryseobacterium lacus TaxID=2058346 RepID=UPI00140DD47C|nr:transposase [Chryseobacterium lacus]